MKTTEYAAISTQKPNFGLFGKRLLAALKLVDLSQSILASRIPNPDPHKEGSISSSLVSRWITGESDRDPRPYIAQITHALCADLKRHLPGQYQQEIADWYGLLGLPLPGERFCLNLPLTTEPIYGDEWPRLKLPENYLYRPGIRDEVIRRLLHLDERNAQLQKNLVALVALPGAGKSLLALEVIEHIRPFFLGAILYGNLQKFSVRELLDMWAEALQISPASTVSSAVLSLRINQELLSQRGRVLVLLEDIESNKEVELLLLNNAWTVVTTRSPKPLVRMGLEDQSFAVPLFTEQETVRLFQNRFGRTWDEGEHQKPAEIVHHLIQGLPMAASLLSAVAKIRGFQYLLSQLDHHERFIPMIQSTSGDIPSDLLKTSLNILIALLSPGGRDLLMATSFLSPGIAVPKLMIGSWMRLLNRDGITDIQSYETAEFELRENRLIDELEEDQRPDQLFLRTHLITATYVANQLDEQKKQIMYNLVVNHIGEILSSVQVYVLPTEKVVPMIKSWRALWLHTNQARNDLIELLKERQLRPPHEDTEEFSPEFAIFLIALYALHGTILAYAVTGLFQASQWLDFFIEPFSRRSRQLHPDDQLWFLWAELHLCMDDPDVIWETFQKTLLIQFEESQRNLLLYSYLAQAAVQQQNLNEAEDILQKATAIEASLFDQPFLIAQDLMAVFGKANLYVSHGMYQIEVGNGLLAEEYFAQSFSALFNAKAMTSPGLSDPDEVRELHIFQLMILTRVIRALSMLRARAGMYEEAYHLNREVMRLMLHIPFLVSLDALYWLGILAVQTDRIDQARVILHVLKKGEVIFHQSEFRSTILNAVLHSEFEQTLRTLSELAQRLEDNHWQGWLKILQQVQQSMNEHGSPFSPPSIPRYSIHPERSADQWLKNWLDELGLPPLRRGDDPFPDGIPW